MYLSTAPFRLSLGLVVMIGILGVHAQSEFIDEDRYFSLLEELRCPKCQHVNLLASNAPIAADLKRTVRRLMQEGQSDHEIRRYLQERYGDYVLYDPPMRLSTLLLWVLPPIFAGIGMCVVFWLSGRGGLGSTPGSVNSIKDQS